MREGPESNSSISIFKQCRKRYYYRYILKLPEKSSPALEHGKEIHERIYKRASGDPETDFGLEVIGSNDIAGHWRDRPVYICKREFYLEANETKFALANDFSLGEFDDKSMLFRGIVDYARCYVDCLGKIYRVELYDWKTGKYRNSRRQLTLYSLFFYAMSGEIDKIKCQNVFVTEGAFSPEWYIRKEDIAEIQDGLKRDIDEVKNESSWRPTRTPLCDWCDFQEVCDGEL